jgi:hypothetical protein
MSGVDDFTIACVLHVEVRCVTCTAAGGATVMLLARAAALAPPPVPEDFSAANPSNSQSYPELCVLAKDSTATGPPLHAAAVSISQPVSLGCWGARTLEVFVVVSSVRVPAAR